MSSYDNLIRASGRLRKQFGTNGYGFKKAGTQRKRRPGDPKTLLRTIAIECSMLTVASACGAHGASGLQPGQAAKRMSISYEPRRFTGPIRLHLRVYLFATSDQPLIPAMTMCPVHLARPGSHDLRRWLWCYLLAPVISSGSGMPTGEPARTSNSDSYTTAGSS